ncbi:helix-turn-helix domain-containing protein [Bacteroides sp. KFT8]|uniref:helix-turn-helix domain-containing protein n=1 Tax=Bacteroides sp. KFT8 TaxID=2025659 RepID=UPI000C03D313|nr:helix-turn-helix transcriptional regulator [Bacteroides sp. KFT8]
MTRIKEILKEKGLTVNQLADMLEISRQALSKQIQGKMLVETAQRIAEALDVPMWQLFASPVEVQEDNNTITCPHCGKKIKIEKGE